MRCTPGFGPGWTVVCAVAPIVEADAAGTAGTARRSAASASSGTIRRGTEPTLVGSDDVPHRPERLLDVYRRHARHGDGEEHHLAGALRDARVRARTSPNRTASGRSSPATTSRPRGTSSPACAARSRRPPSTAAASSAHTGTLVSITAIVIASSSRLRLRKPPCFMRSTASASTGMRCSSGSSPMWRKKMRYACGIGCCRSAIACGPRKRSESSRSRSRSSGGLGPGTKANVIDAMRRPGHSCASSGATSPSTSGGSLTVLSAASRAGSAARRRRSATATCPPPSRPRRRT